MSTTDSASVPRCWGVIPAAGVGRRLGGDVPKQYRRLHGRTVLEHSLLRLLGHPRIEGVVVALAPQDHYWSASHLPTDKPLLTVEGGDERRDSVRQALTALTGKAASTDWVLVHDAARPCLHPDDLDRLIDTLADDPVGGLLVTPVRDTLKRVGADGRIAGTEDRERLYHALTPQMFRLDLLRQALDRALAAGVPVTDEASAVEYLGLCPRPVMGRSDNLKITRPEDLALAEFHLGRQGVN